MSQVNAARPPIAGMQVTRVVSSGPASINTVVDQEALVIAGVTSQGPQRICHCVMGVGYTGHGFRINDPSVEQGFMSYSASRQWSHRGYFH